MRLYEVTYVPSDWSNDRKVVNIVASSLIRAADEIKKRKYSGHSKRVVEVREKGTISVAK